MRVLTIRGFKPNCQPFQCGNTDLILAGSTWLQKCGFVLFLELEVRAVN